jgi:V/A-type H+-transporting ATPase subunit K
MVVRRAVLAVSVVLMVLIAAVAVAAGPAPPEAGEAPARGGSDRGLLALGAGLAIGLAGLGTGIAQSRIGAAGVGAIAEKPESLGVVIILLAIPETVVILGFVVAAIILFL